LKVFENSFWEFFIVIAVFVAFIAELFWRSKLRGRPKHQYRHVPEHLRRQGGGPGKRNWKIDWPKSG
jgi:hypothetical protein